MISCIPGFESLIQLIKSLQLDIAQNNAAIAQDIASNNNDIAALEQDIASNDVDIADNSANIVSLTLPGSSLPQQGRGLAAHQPL